MLTFFSNQTNNPSTDVIQYSIIKSTDVTKSLLTHMKFDVFFEKNLIIIRASEVREDTEGFKDTSVSSDIHCIVLSSSYLPIKKTRKHHVNIMKHSEVIL